MRKLSFYYGCFLFCVCSPPVFLSRILKINSTLNDAPLLTLLSCDIVWHYDNMTPYWLLMEKVLHQFGVLESVFLEQIIATSAQVTPNGLVRKSIQKGLNSDQGTPLQKNMTMAKSPFWTAWEYIKKNGCVFIVCHVNFFWGVGVLWICPHCMDFKALELIGIGPSTHCTGTIFSAKAG